MSRRRGGLSVTAEMLAGGLSAAWMMLHIKIVDSVCQAPAEPESLAGPHGRVANNLNEAVRWVPRAVADGWPGDSQALALLRDRAVNEPDLTVRRDAVQAVADAWPGDPQTPAWLRDRAVNDRHMLVRHTATRAVTKSRRSL